MELSVELYKVVNENEFDEKVTQYYEKKISYMTFRV